MKRSKPLQDFLDAADIAFRVHATDKRAKVSVAKIFSALKTACPTSDLNATRLPVCQHLVEAANPEQFSDPVLRHVIETFCCLEPELEWRLRDGHWRGASDNFPESHANALIVGPGGLEPRHDVSLGVSLVAPHVRYPDHNHPPEETYLVMSDGDFRNDDTNWLSLEPGGTFYNPPGITHVMRSNARPLFAFWALKTETNS